MALGQAATLLPPDVVKIASIVLFLAGAAILVREGRSHQESSGEEFAEKAKPVHGFRAVVASFQVLFAAEWGDLSQLLTLSLVAKYEAPFSVYVGALGALLTVSGLAVIVGRSLLRVISIHVLHYLGATVCLALATLTLWELLS